MDASPLFIRFYMSIFVPIWVICILAYLFGLIIAQVKYFFKYNIQYDIRKMI